MIARIVLCYLLLSVFVITVIGLDAYNSGVIVHHTVVYGWQAVKHTCTTVSVVMVSFGALAWTIMVIIKRGIDK